MIDDAAGPGTVVDVTIVVSDLGGGFLFALAPALYDGLEHGPRRCAVGGEDLGEDGTRRGSALHLDRGDLVERVGGRVIERIAGMP